MYSTHVYIHNVHVSLFVYGNLTSSSVCQVTLTGSWKFFSTLPFPLHLSLVTTRDTETTDNEEDDDSILETFVLPPKLSLPSLVVPAGCLSGVRVKSPHSVMWSDVYPIHSATDEWSKPQLLTEVHMYMCTCAILICAQYPQYM